MEKNYGYEIDLNNMNSVATKILKMIDKDANILEIGCAVGHMTKILTEMLKCHVTCVEIDPAAAEKASAYCRRMLVGDIENIELDGLLKPGEFDVIILADVLEHLKDPWKTLERLRLYLRDDGFILASIPNVAYAGLILDLIEGKFRYRPLGLLDDTHLRFFTRESVRELFERTGYIISYWDRSVIEPSASEFKQRLDNYPQNITDLIYRNNDADTYQFVIKAYKSNDTAIIIDMRHSLDLMQNINIEQENTFRQQLADKEQQLEYTHQQLADKEQHLEYTHQQLADKEQQLASTEQQLASLDDLLNDKEAHLDDFKRQIDSIQMKRADLEHQLSQLQNQLLLIGNSLGWRITMKYRSIMDRFFPEKSGRRSFYELTQKSIKTILLDGLSALVRKSADKEELDPIPDSYNERYKSWIKNYEPKAGEVGAVRKEAASLSYRPLFSIVMPVYNVDEVWLRAAIESVRKQIYDQWELCIADDASTRPHIKKILQEYTNRDKRIRAVFLEENLGISGASNAAIDLATGEFVGLLDNDDELAPFALFEVVKLLNQIPDLDFIYSDEDKLEVNGERTDPFFKPDFSPDLLMSMNYICHFSIFRRELLRKIGGFRQGFEGSQDYDLILRATEHARNIAHIPKILYHWRKIPGSASASVNAKDYAYQAGCKALKEALVRREKCGTVEIREPGRYRVSYEIKGRPLVSIIIPTKDKVAILRRCIESIRKKSSYDNYELIVVDNNSIEEETIHYFDLIKNYPECRVLPFNDSFNYSRINNFAVGQARGDLLLFLNNDTEVITPDWLEEMISHAQRQEIGAVGVKLLFPNNTYQHGGVIIRLGGVAGHAFYGNQSSDPGYMGLASVTRNYSAVTAACLMMRRSAFEEVGGLDEELDVAYNDVDLCLKIVNHKYYVVWTPHAVLYHHESASRGKFQPERNIRYFCDKWQNYMEQGDPYYSPHLALDRCDFMVK